MKKQNLARPLSNDQFLRKAGFKVFYIDQSNISSIGKLIGTSRKTKIRGPPPPQQSYSEQIRQQSSFSYSFQDQESYAKLNQKMQQQQKIQQYQEVERRKPTSRNSTIPAQIQQKIREIIRMNAVQKSQENTEAKLFRERIKRVMSTMSNMGSLSNKHQNGEEPEQRESLKREGQSSLEIQLKNQPSGDAIIRKNGQIARQRPVIVNKAKKVTKIQKLKNSYEKALQQQAQRQLAQMNSKKNSNSNQQSVVSEEQSCERVTRNRMKNTNLEEQSFFQLEIKPKFNKQMAELYKVKQKLKTKKQKIEQPNQKKKIKKAKKPYKNQQELFERSLSKKQKQILNAILINNLPPRNPTIKHEHNSVDSNQILLKPLIKDNKLYFASQMLHYTKKTKSLSVRCTNRYFSFVEETLKSSQNCKTIPQVPAQSVIKKIKLKRNFELTNKKTLVLDLDQTLIHSQGLYQKADKEIFPFSFQFDKTTRHYTIRNYAKQLVKNLSQKFYIVVFTSAVQGYADNILEHIDPEQKYIQHRLYRSNCYLHGEKYPYIKDLRILNRDLSQIIIVDNSLYAFWFNIDNGVPIVSFTGIQDDELRKLEKYLLLLENVDDVRKVNRKAFHLHLYQEHQSSKDLLNAYCQLMQQEADSKETEVIEL